jgi:hypothetical protein
VALPLETLGTTYSPRTNPSDADRVPVPHGAMVAKNGLAEVV